MLSTLPQATYEGDFVVLSIQVGQQLLNAVSAKMLKGKKENPSTPMLQYIYDFDPANLPKPIAKGEVEARLQDHEFLLQCLRNRACWTHYTTAETFQEEVMARQGKVDASALDAVKIEMQRMTYAHAYVLYGELMKQRVVEIEKEFGPNLGNVMNPLFELFCLVVMDTSYDKGGGFGDFVACGCLPASASKLITKRIKELLKTLRPQAVPIVDAWNIPDFLLNSCLGRYDGRVYEALYDQARSEPLNQTEIHEGYYKHLQYLLHPERRHTLPEERSKL